MRSCQQKGLILAKINIGARYVSLDIPIGLPKFILKITKKH
jgi:hypothetical protein